MAKSVFQADAEAKSIQQALTNALNFHFEKNESLYGQGRSAKQIVEILLQQDFQSLLPKQFNDLNCIEK